MGLLLCSPHGRGGDNTPALLGSVTWLSQQMQGSYIPSCAVSRNGGRSAEWVTAVAEGPRDSAAKGASGDPQVV